MNWFRCDDARNYVLTLHVQPGAKRTEAIGLHGDALKIKLAAAPIEGKANAALLKYLAECFEVPQNQVLIRNGEKSRRKTVMILQSRHSPDSLFRF
ncbi:MAG: YggU family protein [Burkholderiales bacterium]|nr:YggU family protein [Nitrosomonas sp.]MCP5275296.1 YggU family protein [Burkholderiales bacterium]